MALDLLTAPADVVVPVSMVRGASGSADHRATSAADSRVMSAAEVIAMRERLVGATTPEGQADQIDLLRALEELKAAVTAVQATTAIAFDTAVRREEASADVPAAKRGRGVPSQVALALRESPARARSFLGAARAWRAEMPQTFAALRAGRLSAWRATLLVRETAHLPVEARQIVDREICADVVAMEGMGTARLIARAKKRAAELDPAAAADRARRAAGERSVWIRPAPDTMSYVTALLPVAQGVGVYAALRRAADAATARGDERSRGQVMADTFVERVTGQTGAEVVPLAVNLVVSDATLLGAGHAPAVITADAGPGGGVVPAQVARNLVASGLDANAVWLRRLYVDPGGNLVAASSKARFFADGLAALLRARDQGICRTPFCDAPVRHLDHVLPAAGCGTTAFANGQGLCEACNQAKNTGALDQWVTDGAPRHTVVTTTPTGHVYSSTAPEPPRPAAVAPTAAQTAAPAPTAAPAVMPATARASATARAPAVAGRKVGHGPPRRRRRRRPASAGRSQPLSLIELELSRYCEQVRADARDGEVRADVFSGGVRVDVYGGSV